MCDENECACVRVRVCDENESVLCVCLRAGVLSACVCVVELELLFILFVGF